MSVPVFVGHITSNPLLIPNKYNVTITSPFGTYGQDVSMNCIAANIPSRSIATVERFIYGPTTKVPYVEIFDDLSLTFRLSADMYERGVIEQWMDRIGGRNYGAQYFDDIKGTVLIQVMHRDDSITKTYVFKDAVPLNISETGLSQDAEEPTTVTIQFGYHHYEMS